MERSSHAEGWVLVFGPRQPYFIKTGKKVQPDPSPTDMSVLYSFLHASSEVLRVYCLLIA